MRSVFFLLMLMMNNINCTHKKSNIELIENTDYMESNLQNFNFITPSGQVFLISIDKFGNLFSINSDTTNDFQTVYYTSNRKVSNLFNYKDNKLEGRAYYFDEHSGYLSADFNYVNGTKSGNAVLYHDSTAMLKETMLYNDFGELYFREKYDRNGKVIGREGNDGMGTEK